MVSAVLEIADVVTMESIPWSDTGMVAWSIVEAAMTMVVERKPKGGAATND